VSVVRDVEIAASIQDDSFRVEKLCGRRWTSIANLGIRISEGQPGGDTISNDRRDHAGGSDFPNALIPDVGDVEVARIIHSHVLRTVEFRGDCRSAIATEAGSPVAGNGVDDAGRRHAAHKWTYGN